MVFEILEDFLDTRFDAENLLEHRHGETKLAVKGESHGNVKRRTVVTIGSVEKIEGSRENVGLVLHNIGVDRLVKSRVVAVHGGMFDDELALLDFRRISADISSRRNCLSRRNRLERERVERHILLEIISRIHCVETHCDRVVVAVIVLLHDFNVLQKRITASPTEIVQKNHLHDRETRIDGTGEVGVAIG